MNRTARRSALSSTLALFRGGCSLCGCTSTTTSLLYPDGYQYLLMARGIGEHLQPTTVLGPGGDMFVPNADAAVKPLFPIAVAVVHALGVLVARCCPMLVTVAAGAWVVTAVALLVRAQRIDRRWTGSGHARPREPERRVLERLLGSRSARSALVLSAALAFVDRRARLGGVLMGLAIAARPEIVLLALAAGVLALRNERDRALLRRAAPATLLTATLVFAVLRTPVAVPDWRLVSLVPAALIALALVMRAPPELLRYAGIASLPLVALVVLDRPGPSTLWVDDRPLLLVAAVALLILLCDRGRSSGALVVLAAVLLLGAVYLVKNPALGRYFALLLPAAAIVAGLAVAAVPRRVRPPGSRPWRPLPRSSLLAADPGQPRLRHVPRVAAASERALDGDEPWSRPRPTRTASGCPATPSTDAPGMRGACCSTPRSDSTSHDSPPKGLVARIGASRSPAPTSRSTPIRPSSSPALSS